MLSRIISGGQTGVDRAALDAAMALGIEVGGWCPKGRRALDGVIPVKYPLIETRGKSYQTRTKWNVRDSDATLIICRDEPTGGTALTIKYCEQLGRPFEVCRLNPDHYASPDSQTPLYYVYWLNALNVQVLNVAGPREGKRCPIYGRAYNFLSDLFRQMQEDNCACEPAASYIVPFSTALVVA